MPSPGPTPRLAPLRRRRPLSAPAPTPVPGPPRALTKNGPLVPAPVAASASDRATPHPLALVAAAAAVVAAVAAGAVLTRPLVTPRPRGLTPVVMSSAALTEHRRRWLS
jgi:hypothetical protein